MAEKETPRSELAEALKALQDALKRAEELGVEDLEGFKRSEVPGWNRGAHDVASGGRHDVAVEFGFAKRDIDGETILYTHPQHGTLFMYGDGEWEHLASDGTSSKGSGSGDLKRHLMSLAEPAQENDPRR